VKLLDFGLSKLVQPLSDSDKTANATAAHIGTVPYMAPEQLRGEPADHRSDIWALGVVLYEMTVGDLPFRGGSTFVLSSAILHDPPVPLPRTVLAGLRKVSDRYCPLVPSSGQASLQDAEWAAASVCVNSRDSIGPLFLAAAS
jgi:serine/threonine protein kinase